MNSNNGDVMQGETKIYVIDTSVLIDHPDVFYKLIDSEIVIPTAVIKELDGIKKNTNPDEPKAKAARKVARTLDGLGGNQDIAAGAKISVNSTVRIYSRYAIIDDLASKGDNRIVGAAIRLMEAGAENVVLLSRDINVRNIARSYGVKAEHYPFCHAIGPTKPNGKRPLEQKSIKGPIKPLPKEHIHKQNSETRAVILATVMSAALLFLILLLISK